MVRDKREKSPTVKNIRVSCDHAATGFPDLSPVDLYVPYSLDVPHATCNASVEKCEKSQ